MTKMGTITVVWNATIMVAIVPVAVEAVVTVVVGNGAGLPLTLRLLCALWLLPALCLFCMPRLLLVVLRLLGMCFFPALFPLTFLSEPRDGDSEK